MTRQKKGTAEPDFQERPETGDHLDCGLEIGHLSRERAAEANRVGSAIAHQLNEPLTALRLYVSEIRQNGHRFGGGEDTEDGMQHLVEGAFRETERVCAIMKSITDRFEEPLNPESAPALGRDVISWWSRSGSAKGCDPEQVVSIQELLTPREQEVLEHISQGCSNKQGAIMMQIGPRTFESHRFRIMRKLGARNGADLVRLTLGQKPATL